ncbi:MAG: 16S rRNA (guanine(527)-N(7))-methyltransferase RsmG [Nocardioidaceae bacterium]
MPFAAIGCHFPQRRAEIEEYAGLLSTVGVERGLIGPREASRVWDRHILNCAVIAPLFEHGATVADIGSGAGLPGLVLALSRPDMSLTLIEPIQRRTAFLSEVVEHLRMSNVTVVRGRAEDLYGAGCFDVVTARAVAPLDRLAHLALPLCRRGGELVAIKGSRAVQEVKSARRVLLELSAGQVRIEHYGAGLVSSPTVIVRIQAPGETQPHSSEARP